MKTKQKLLIVLVLLLLTSFACSFPGAPASLSGQPEGYIENYIPAARDEPLLFYSYSPDQMAVHQEYGTPTRFTVLFSEEIRQETWIYDMSGYQVVFRNGVKISEKTGEPTSLEGLSVVMYEPGFFNEGMGIDEVVLATGQRDFVLTSLDDVVQGRKLMHLKGLSVGFSGGEILFVETLPVPAE